MSTILFFAGAAAGMDPNRALPQYIRNKWSVQQGFPGGTVYAIAEGLDGYLWIGAENGLVRFDGVNFKLFNHANTPALAVGPVLGLAESQDGDLWIRMEGPNMFRYHGGVLQDVSSDFSRVNPPLPVTAMSGQKSGDLLFASKGDAIYKYHGGKLTLREIQTPRPRFLVISVAETGDGTVWLGTPDSGLFSTSNRGGPVFSRGLLNKNINCLLPSGDGDRELWIGTDSGLMRWDGTKIAAAGLNHIQVLSLIRDRESNVWAGTAGGLARIDSKGVAALDTTGVPVTALFEDRDGNLWTGGAGGIERFRDSVFLSNPASSAGSENSGPLYADSENRIWFAPSNGGLSYLRSGRVERLEVAGMSNDPVYSISGSPGELWIGRQRGGLTHLLETGGSFAAKTYTRADGLAQDSVYTVHRSRDGSVWAGTVSGGISRFRNGRFTTYTSANGLASDSVSAMLEGSGGAMWFATSNGLNEFSNGLWRVYSGREGLPSGNINCLIEDSAGVLWIGTSDGLAFLRSGRVQVPGKVPDSLHEEVFGVAEDANGWLWISTSAHVLRVKRDKLLSGRFGEGDVREYGFRDGLLSTEGVKRDRSVIGDAHGRIWLSMSRGISVVDPSRLTRDPQPAVVYIQAVSADGRPLDLSRAVRIPSTSQRIIFTYTGVSLSAPERVRYKYMLDGLDRVWSEPTATTEAGYSNLRPRNYRFRVAASDADGLWNSAEASIRLVVEPMIWQTWWFNVTTGLAFVLAVLALIRYRMLQLTRQLNLRFEERLAERTRIAQELHDTLLQGIVSASMQLHMAVDRLPADSPAQTPLGGVLEVMKRVVDEGRNTVQGLRSSYSSIPDLAQSFSTIQQELAVQPEIDFRVIVDGQPRALHPLLRDEFYRIGREALLNAFRHSHATSIEVELAYAPKGLRMLIRDNGCGIAPDVVQSGREGHWGLPGMRERAEKIGAQLHVWSSTAAGTEIELSVPSRLAFEFQPSNSLLKLFGRLFQRENGRHE
ncbi:MAG: two-component regulator propeller domain-containing protein [Bryobacteraceae bacterium]